MFARLTIVCRCAEAPTVRCSGWHRHYGWSRRAPCDDRTEVNIHFEVLELGKVRSEDEPYQLRCVRSELLPPWWAQISDVLDTEVKSSTMLRNAFSCKLLVYGWWLTTNLSLASTVHVVDDELLKITDWTLWKMQWIRAVFRCRECLRTTRMIWLKPIEFVLLGPEPLSQNVD